MQHDIFRDKNLYSYYTPSGRIVFIYFSVVKYSFDRITYSVFYFLPNFLTDNIGIFNVYGCSGGECYQAAPQALQLRGDGG